MEEKRDPRAAEEGQGRLDLTNPTADGGTVVQGDWQGYDPALLTALLDD
jgi:hypothetical protein